MGEAVNGPPLLENHSALVGADHGIDGDHAVLLEEEPLVNNQVCDLRRHRIDHDPVYTAHLRPVPEEHIHSGLELHLSPRSTRPRYPNRPSNIPSTRVSATPLRSRYTATVSGVPGGQGCEVLMDSLLTWAIAGCGVLIGVLLALVIGGPIGWVIGAGAAVTIAFVGARTRRHRTDEVLRERLRRSV